LRKPLWEADAVIEIVWRLDALAVLDPDELRLRVCPFY